LIDLTSRALAMAFLAGPWEAGALFARANEALETEPHWLRRIIRRVIAKFPTPPPEGAEPLAAALCDDEDFRRGASQWTRTRVRRWLAPEAAMIAVGGPPATFAVPALPTNGDLASALGLTPPELAWFADARHLNEVTTATKLSHYRCKWVTKASGGFRLLEAPKPRLRERQRWLLRNVLAFIPPSPQAHGFVGGRDVGSFVRPHSGRALVVRLDVEDFFSSVTRARIVALFRRVGYPRDVAETLANLCTVATPRHVLDAHPKNENTESPPQRFLANARLRDRHLPQGAPTSPALSNLVVWRMDTRLAALAAGFGATMTRYADDLAFSGDETFARSVRFFLPRAGAIVLEEGFRLNHRKTLVMPRGHRQELCGVAISVAPNVPRRERDRLRAILFNARKHGLESQNRDGHADFRRHLEGKIAWVEAVNARATRRLGALTS
jgi:RNA-directed DNA polymerase